jgi:NAD(P)-dependent dehydrogenase (short-subunit alcohol dehydrogenase family)
VIYRVADVRDRESIDVWIQETVQRWGGLDGAVNAAGIHPRESGVKPIWDVTDDDWQFAQDVNVSGMRNCVRAQLKHMVSASKEAKESSGSIVVLGSNSSVVGAPNLSAYITSKHAVVGLARAAAMDAAPYNIRVNAVCP